MHVIDRYLVRQFIRVFVMTFLSLLGVYVVADFVTNLAEFMELQRTTARFGQVVSNYYLMRVPWFFDLVAPMVILLSAVFVLAWLQRHNELTALMAAGVPRWRIVKPVVACGTIMVLVSAVNREVSLPMVAHDLARDVKDLIKNHSQKMTSRYDNESEILYGGEAVFLAERRIDQPKLRLPREWPNFGRTLRAREATYLESTRDRPSGYLLEGVVNGERLTGTESLRMGDRCIVLSPRDHPWLKPDQCFVPSNMPVEYLQDGRGSYRHMSTASLIGGIHAGSLNLSPDVRVALHSRVLQPVLDLALLFMGIAPALRIQRHHVFAAAAKCMLVILLFTLVVLLGHALGIQDLMGAVLAVWAPAMILVPLTVLMSGPLRT
jgi:lipopolysaccharide export system permease protein